MTLAGFIIVLALCGIIVRGCDNGHGHQGMVSSGNEARIGTIGTIGSIGTLQMPIALSTTATELRTTLTLPHATVAEKSRPPNSTTVPTTTTSTTEIVRIMTVDSTSYCQSGRTASGMETYVGEVAGNMWALGTKLRILSGEHKGEVVVVEDRIGAHSQLDFYTPSCRNALVYGREEIKIEVLK